MGNSIQRVDNVLHGPRVDIPIDDKGLGRTIFEKMRQYGERILQIDPETSEYQTYENVNRKCIRLALALRSRGINAGDIILMCSENTMESLVLTYATLYLNAITVTLDPHMSLIDAVHLLNTISPKLIFAVENSIALIKNSLAQLDITPKIVIIGTHRTFGTLIEYLKPHSEEQTFVPDCVGNVKNTAIIFCSSGTTGLPKAICFSHDAILKSCIGLSLTAIDCTTCLHYTSVHHIVAFLFTTVGIILGGRRIIGGRFTPENFLRYVQDYKVTFSTLTPTCAIQFNDENTKNYKTSSLIEMRICGTIVGEEQMKILTRCFPETNIYTSYGQTESSVTTTFSKFSDCFAKTKLSSCGVPFINTKIKISDVETGHKLPPYEKGEIRLINNTTFSGYYNESSQNCFDNEGFLKTGDIGYYDEDNCLYFCGRLQESFRYRHWCIVPACIEANIYKHPAVLEAIVIGMPHEIDLYHALALIVLREDCNASEQELLSFINTRVPNKEKLRGGVKIVKELPKTSTGKIPRQVIRQMLLTGRFNQFYT
ncbi:hypothetical protein Trydic_g16119 [Trypoxylus dichotomus]